MLRAERECPAPILLQKLEGPIHAVPDLDDKVFDEPVRIHPCEIHEEADRDHLSGGSACAERIDNIERGSNPVGGLRNRLQDSVGGRGEAGVRSGDRSGSDRIRENVGVDIRGGRGETDGGAPGKAGEVGGSYMGS